MLFLHGADWSFLNSRNDGRVAGSLSELELSEPALSELALSELAL
jgi:hypothetical protein